jgi:hypothetical protein
MFGLIALVFEDQHRVAWCVWLRAPGDGLSGEAPTLPKGQALVRGERRERYFDYGPLALAHARYS